MKDYKCTNVQGKVNPIIKEALDNYKPIKCRCRGNNCWYEDTIVGIMLNKNLDGFEYIGLYGEYEEAIPILMKQEVKYRLLPPEEAIPLLIMRGWKFDNHGTLRKEGNPALSAGMFAYLGRVISSKEAGYYPSCILEEVQEGEDDGDW
jgi:hypothetical protein